MLGESVPKLINQGSIWCVNYFVSLKPALFDDRMSHDAIHVVL